MKLDQKSKVKRAKGTGSEVAASPARGTAQAAARAQAQAGAEAGVAGATMPTNELTRTTGRG